MICFCIVLFNCNFFWNKDNIDVAIRVTDASDDAQNGSVGDEGDAEENQENEDEATEVGCNTSWLCSIVLLQLLLLHCHHCH